MAKQIKWSSKALEDRYSISAYFMERNKSNDYSFQLDEAFIETAERIARNPEIGKESNDKDFRSVVVKNYKLIYKETANEIRIIRVWDTRQDPNKLKL